MIAYLCLQAGMTAEQVANDHSSTPLRALVSEGLRFFERDPTLQNGELFLWFRPLRKNLDRKLDDLLKNKRLRRQYAGLLDCVVGDICLKQFCSENPTGEVQGWCDNTEDIRLIARILNGDQGASNLVYQRHGKPIKGFIAMRVRNNDHIDDLCQEAWLEILKGLIKFDPAQGSFHGFSMGCGRNVLRRFWHGRPGAFEVPPEDEDEDGNACGEPQVPPLDGDLFDEFMVKTFGGASPPHQLIAFGFVKLLEWNPAEVVEELSAIGLDKLIARLEEELCEVYTPAEEIVHESLQKLNRAMRQRKKLSEMLADPKNRETYAHLLDRIVGETCLREYYTSKAPWNSQIYLSESAQTVSNWWVSVKRRTFKEMSQNDC